MSIATDTYAKLFKLASESRKVQTAVKLAKLWDVLKTPAAGYGLGLAGLGAGIPLAYHLGQKDNKEDIEAVRNQAFAAGVNLGQNAQVALPPLPTEQEQQQMLGLMPDENMENYFGLAPGDNDVYGDDYPDFGSFDRVGYY